MFGLKVPAKRRSRDDGEKPFWISFSDLMSALMVLFLVVMSVTLLTVTKKVSTVEREEAERQQEISQLLADVAEVAKSFEGVVVNGSNIDFGTRALFEREGQNTLSKPQKDLLREFAPLLLEKLTDTDAGKRWFKRAVVEGYASRSGSYLFNLNLSLERSQRVLCELLRTADGQKSLELDDRRLIAQRFFVGGASFNSLRADSAASRRIEIKLEFRSRDEARSPPPSITEVDLAALDTALDPKKPCLLQDR